jgi:hypothetical protein
MGRAAVVVSPEFREALAEAYIVNDRMNQMVLEYLDPRAWRVKPPGVGAGARPIVAIVTHMHNIRRKWIRLSAPQMKLPAELDRARCTQKQARTALADSARRCAEMIREALAGPEGRVPKFHRDGWAPKWNGGAAMFTYMVAHDAHAGAPTGIQAADEGDFWDVGMGEAVEGVRLRWAEVMCVARLVAVA